MIIFAPLEWLLWIAMVGMLVIFFIAFPIHTLIVIGLFVWMGVGFARKTTKLNGESQDE